MCRIVKLSTSYYYRKYKEKYVDGDAEVKSKMIELSNQHRKSLGRLKMHMLLIRYGYQISMYKVTKYLKELNINCKLRYKKYRLARGEESNICPNILKRNFVATKMYEKLVTDVTEFKIGTGKVYLSIILDLYNNEILGYGISERANFEFIFGSIKQALSRVPEERLEGMIFHSDQGWAYGMKDLQIELKGLKIQQSMSRRGNCYDNAVVESIFGHIKSEMFYNNKKITKKEELIVELKEYIYYYNNTRVQTKLKGYAPAQVRT